MRQLYITAAFILILLSSLTLKAQEGKALLGIRAGHSAPFGGFAAASLEAEHSLERYFSITGGALYSTIGKAAVELRPSYFHDFECGRLSAEILLHSTNLSSFTNLAIGSGIGFKGKWVDIKLGYYYRMYGNNNGWLKEPLNIYYEFGVNCLPKSEKWDLRLSVSNNEILELERHYQPSYIIQGWYYPGDRIGITLGLNYKPAGTFHLSVDYYQFHSKVGICYRW